MPTIVKIITDEKAAAIKLFESGGGAWTERVQPPKTERDYPLDHGMSIHVDKITPKAPVAMHKPAKPAA